MDFLSIYTKIHGQAFSTTNILSGFTAAGLIPLKLERVLVKLNIKTPTLPSSSSSNQSFYLGRTPVNLYQLNQQKKADSRSLTTVSILCYCKVNTKHLRRL